jgi:hypothetical protein
MRKIFFPSLILVMIFLLINKSHAQGLSDNKQYVKVPYTDSLYREFVNTIYNAFYNPSYMMTQSPTFTILKIAIDKQGKVADIRFSDSADSSLVKAWKNKPKSHDDVATLEKYAKAKAYKNISILIPVIFEPNAPNLKKQFTYEQAESLFKFNRQSFSGSSIMMSPIPIPVLSDHNM